MKEGKKMSEMITTVTFKVDSEVKRQSKELFSELGLDMSAAINMFLRQCIREQGLPFISSIRPNAETLKAIEDARKGIGLHGPFDSYEEMVKDIMTDED